MNYYEVLVIPVLPCGDDSALDAAALLDWDGPSGLLLAGRRC